MKASSQIPIEVDLHCDFFYLDCSGEICLRRNAPPWGEWSLYHRLCTKSRRALTLLEFGQSGYYFVVARDKPITFSGEQAAMEFLIPEPAISEFDQITRCSISEFMRLDQLSAVSFYRTPPLEFGRLPALIDKLGQLRPVTFGQLEQSPVSSREP